ncbi:uncharacterized protein LOC124455596 [Xenia sp. Carnegie-2017]|uniref:uncharacterized protein LOC124455596 n=1 Tax=Xenia sp. Carnegie-2017 TaxID=2897299 RepID=UPI001F04D0BF|nr:uncharacterized protein LOC124455596 [Xenia sp. Carnegie-2017]
MKVSMAKNLLSRKTGAAIHFLIQEKVLPKNGTTTAWFCDQVGLWYNLMTSRSSTMGFSLYTHEKHTEVVSFLESIIKLFTQLKIGSESNAKWRPAQTGTILATKTILELQNCFILEKQYKFLQTSCFTQDCTLADQSRPKIVFSRKVCTNIELYSFLGEVSLVPCSSTATVRKIKKHETLVKC